VRGRDPGLDAIPGRARARGTPIGNLDEDYAIESNAGDVFQLGNASWRILRVHQGVVRVVDAKGAPPSLPFWFGEAPARTRELSAGVSAVREDGTDAQWLEREAGIGETAAREVSAYLEDARTALGAMPTATRFVLERFFDESGGAQLVLHAPCGSRINIAPGPRAAQALLPALRLRAAGRAASSDHVLISLSPQHSFPLEEVYEYVTRERGQGAARAGRARDAALRVALAPQRHPLARGRAQPGRSARAAAAPAHARRRRARARVPRRRRVRRDAARGRHPDPVEHPLVRQTLSDCLEEGLDADGMVATLEALADGTIERVAVDTVQPSPFARAALSTDALRLPRRRAARGAAHAGRDGAARDRPPHGGDARALDPDAIAAVQAEAWPDPRDAEEVHEALSWMGFVTVAEAGTWADWLRELERRAASCTKATAGSPSKRRAIPSRCCEGAWKCSGPSCRTSPKCSSSSARAW
jgi:ATP-dependent Lhr-like helicase